MHGLIFAQLQKYADTKVGPGTWQNLLKEAGYEHKLYLPIQEYPDEELVTLVGTASRLTGIPIPALLEDFGAFIVPGLVQMYGAHIKPEWSALDVIENTEEAIHTAVRRRNPEASPPQLVATRTSPNEVVVKYTSKRKMCSVAKGIAQGVADHYGEPVRITESQCMNTGGSACDIHIVKAA